MIFALQLLLVLVALTNGQLGKDCRKQMKQFYSCMSTVFISTDKDAARQNLFKDAMKNCYKSNGCLAPGDELPHNDDWEITQCQNDLYQAVEQKVVQCIRQRVSLEFQKPPDAASWLYGAFYYESTPQTNRSIFETMCLNGNLTGTQQCNKDFMKRNAQNQSEVNAYWTRVCDKRYECLDLLGNACTKRYLAYWSANCECGYDVHDLYGGQRLLSRIPSCAKFQNRTDIRYSAVRERKSCQIDDLMAGSWKTMCTMGYEEYLKKYGPGVNTTTPMSTVKTTGKF